MSIGPFIIPNLFDLYLYVQCNILTLYLFIFIHSPHPLSLSSFSLFHILPTPTYISHLILLQPISIYSEVKHFNWLKRVT